LAMLGYACAKGPCWRRTGFMVRIIGAASVECLTAAPGRSMPTRAPGAGAGMG
jgi:hypothetical protein